MRMFAPYALPTNRQAWRMALDGAGNPIAPHMLNTDQRAVLRGTGFYEVLSRKTNGLSIGALPSMCYRLYDDRYLMQCIIEEAGYHHRKRFREYLMGRELNIGLVIGPPGSGKTTFGAAAALAMQVQLGQILCSGPSHASIDIFAHRLDQRARAVAARYNTVMPSGDAERCHHRLVIRIYRPGDEINAVTQLLRDPQDVDWAARRAYWFLVVLRSNAVPPLHVDSKPGLVNLQADIDTRPALLHLLGDFLCVHPSDAEVSPITHWKRILARGLAVDEAGSMSRADFYGLWGNTLLPCFLVGDPNKNPVVLTTDEKDADGNLYNRFAADGAVSPLKFLMATGIPVFRLEDSTRR
ncbi:DNA helicase [Fusarium oxysporum f. sp. phaseoli]